MADFFRFLDSINKTKKNLLEDPESDPQVTEKEYKKFAYVINRIFSRFPDTLYYAQAMNQRSSLDGAPQYLFYLHGVSKRPRYAKGAKDEKPENLDLVKEYYSYSDKKAREALKILTEKDLLYIAARLYQGGIKKRKNVL
jgi:hypothetical protein